MLGYDLPALSSGAAKHLKKQQEKVIGTYKEQIDRATALFDKKKNTVFDEIRAALSVSSAESTYCHYCENDKPRDIEHIKPKRHYPTLCFVWENYAYACAACNQDEKGDRFAVFADDGSVIEFDRTRDPALGEPSGEPVFIDIRRENPFHFMRLDVLSWKFVTPHNSDPRGEKRCKFTVDLLNLNQERLCKARESMEPFFTGLLDKLTNALLADDPERISGLKRSALRRQHPTVLIELIRYRQKTGKATAADEAILAAFTAADLRF